MFSGGDLLPCGSYLVPSPLLSLTYSWYSRWKILVRCKISLWAHAFSLLWIRFFVWKRSPDIERPEAASFCSKLPPKKLKWCLCNIFTLLLQLCLCLPCLPISVAVWTKTTQIYKLKVKEVIGYKKERRRKKENQSWLAKLGGFSSESALESNLLEYSKTAACSEIWRKKKSSKDVFPFLMEVPFCFSLLAFFYSLLRLQVV